MEKLSVAIEKRPEKTDAEHQQRRPCESVTQRCPADPDRKGVISDEPHLPGLHGQGPASSAPARDKVDSQDQEQVKLEEETRASREASMGRSIERQTRDESDREHDQRLV